jgi:hypothetical protein
VLELQRYTRPVVIAHVCATFFMVGIIWTVHVLHYPLFKYVGDETYVEFQQAHVDRIGPLLFIPWLTEGVTLLAILGIAFIGDRRDLRIPTAINALAMAVVLVISGFWSAPAHGDLSDGFDADVHDRLMTANFVRTFAWTVCGAMAVWTLILSWRSNTNDNSNSQPVTVP